MASQQELIDVLVSQGELPRASVERVAVLLRKAGMLQVGGRGPYSPAVTCRDGSNLLIGVAGSKITPGAVRAVQTFSGLEIDVKDRRRLRLQDLAFLNNVTFFGDFLNLIFENPDAAKQVCEVVFNQTFPEVQIIFDGGTEDFEDQFGIWFRRPKGPDGILGIETKVHVPGHIIQAVATLIRRGKI